MKLGTSIFALVIVAGLSSVGCVHSASTQLQKDVETARAERDPVKLFEYGVSFRQVGDLTRAEQYLNAALEAGADEKKVFPVLLDVCIADRRYRSGVNYTEDYLKKHPMDYRLRFVLATLYSALDEQEHAKSELERVIAADPNVADAHYMLAVLLRDYFAELQGADAQFREYLRLEPHGGHQEEAHGSLLSRVE